MAALDLRFNRPERQSIAVVRFADSSIMQSLTVHAAWCCVNQPLGYLYGLDRRFLFYSEIWNGLPSTSHN